MERFRLKDKLRCRLPARKQTWQYSIDRFLDAMSTTFRNNLNAQRREFGIVKCQLVIKARFHKLSPTDQEVITKETMGYFCSPFHVITITSNIRRCYGKIVVAILRHSDTFTAQSSGWSLRRICFADIIMLWLVNNAFGAGEGNASAELPPSLELRHCVYAVKHCPENECFPYSITAIHLQLKRPGMQKAAVYEKYVNSLQYLQRPMMIAAAPTFEKANKIAVNIFTWNEDSKRLHALYHIRLKRKKRFAKIICNQSKQVYVCDKYYLTFAKKK